MDSKEFDDLLGDKLGAEQSFDFQEPDWIDLSQKLDEADGRKKRLPFWFWTGLGLMAVVVLGGVLFLWKDLEETKKLVQNLELNATQKNIIVNDTIYNTITITEYDTIQKTVFIDEIAERILPAKKGVYNFENEVFDSNINEKKTAEDLVIYNKKNQNNFYNSEVRNQQNLLPINEIEKGKVVDVLEKLRPAFAIEFRKNEVVQSQSVEAWKNKNVAIVFPKAPNLPSNKIQKLPRKKRFRLGLLGALYLPEQQTILGYTPDGFFKQNSHAFGFRTEFSLTDNWSITGDIAYQKTTFETNDPNFVQPLILVEEIQTGIDSLNVNESNLSYGIGIKYFLGKLKKIQPYTHLRLQAIGGLKQSVSGVIPAGPYSERILYESVQKRSGIALESVETGLGIQYRFLRNISWQAEGNYHFYLDKIDDSYRSNSAFKTSLLFHF